MRGGLTIREPTRRPPAPIAVRAGHYFRSERDLYYVKYRGFDRVILEDCWTGELIDAAVEEVRSLRPVSPAGAGQN